MRHNETSRDISLPPGTVVAQVYSTDTVAVAQQSKNIPTTINPELFNFGNSSVPEGWKKRLSQKSSDKGNVFSLEEWDVGIPKEVEHHINLHDPRPFRERSRRLAPADIEDARRHIKDILAAGIITESRSPYASPIVIARKKNGAVRMCIDYRTLNQRTIPDQYTTPRIDDALDCLVGSKWFSLLDLRSGYYQIKMAEESKEKTLDHIVSAEGISPDPEKVKAITSWKMPTDLKTLRSFLGFCGFYRRFIKNYSAIVRPLTELTKCYLPAKGKRKITSEGKMYFRETDPFGER